VKFSSLNILADENVSPRLVAFLRQKGLDVIDVKEKGWQGADDKRLMDMALGERRFILTHDSDFGTLSINDGVSCYGIIYLRLHDLKLSNVISVMEKLLMLVRDIEEGTLIVVEDKKVRIRKILQEE
jgi:predicted nuclease of predicted toxin-antitoxin system